MADWGRAANTIKDDVKKAVKDARSGATLKRFVEGVKDDATKVADWGKLLAGRAGETAEAPLRAWYAQLNSDPIGFRFGVDGAYQGPASEMPFDELLKELAPAYAENVKEPAEEVRERNKTLAAGETALDVTQLAALPLLLVDINNAYPKLLRATDNLTGPWFHATGKKRYNHFNEDAPTVSRSRLPRATEDWPIHAGTPFAAVHRAASLGIPRDQLKLVQMLANTKQPLGSFEFPATDGSANSMQYGWLRDLLKNYGFDSSIYRNTVEDPRSRSLMALTRNIVQPTGTFGLPEGSYFHDPNVNAAPTTRRFETAQEAQYREILRALTGTDPAVAHPATFLTDYLDRRITPSATYQDFPNSELAMFMESADVNNQNSAAAEKLAQVFGDLPQALEQYPELKAAVWAGKPADELAAWGRMMVEANAGRTPGGHRTQVQVPVTAPLGTASHKPSYNLDPDAELPASALSEFPNDELYDTISKLTPDGAFNKLVDDINSGKYDFLTESGAEDALTFLRTWYHKGMNAPASHAAVEDAIPDDKLTDLLEAKQLYQKYASKYLPKAQTPSIPYLDESPSAVKWGSELGPDHPGYTGSFDVPLRILTKMINEGKFATLEDPMGAFDEVVAGTGNYSTAVAKAIEDMSVDEWNTFMEGVSLFKNYMKGQKP